tara:strand:+ start:277 stop:1137 length:861 start_codon:yes stop_codon:yes gene_type:complete
MKVIYVAVFTETSTNTPQANAFEKLGHDVIRYDFKEKLKEFGKTNLRDEDLINTCVSENPDLLLFSKGVGISSSIISTCQDICHVALWYMDPMINVDEELKQKITQVNSVFYTAPAVYRQLKDQNPQSYLIHEGYDPKIHKFYDKIDKVYNASFLGFLKEHRRQYYESYNFNCFTDKYNTDHCKIVNQTRINLNFTNNQEGTSDRAYKIMGAGGFLLTEPWEGLEIDFKPQEDLVVFNNETEFKDKIEYYLKHWEERKHIARNGYDKVRSFTVENWAKLITERVKV